MTSLNTFVIATRTALLALLIALPLSVRADSHEKETPTARAMAMTIEAEVVDVDPEFRQVTLKGPMGNVVTVTAGEEVTNFKDIKVGDTLVASYMAALEGELREPTAEELENPWVVVEDSAASEEGEPAAVGKARLIRAVCTIEGMNRALGTVTVKDPRGKLHMIGEVEPEKMEGVTLGQTVVLVYTEALAVSLEKVTD
jgi:hypothetical protein